MIRDKGMTVSLGKSGFLQGNGFWPILFFQRTEHGKKDAVL